MEALFDRGNKIPKSLLRETGPSAMTSLITNLNEMATVLAGCVDKPRTSEEHHEYGKALENFLFTTKSVTETLMENLNRPGKENKSHAEEKTGLDGLDARVERTESTLQKILERLDTCTMERVEPMQEKRATSTVSEKRRRTLKWMPLWFLDTANTFSPLQYLLKNRRKTKRRRIHCSYGGRGGRKNKKPTRSTRGGGGRGRSSNKTNTCSGAGRGRGRGKNHTVPATRKSYKKQSFRRRRSPQAEETLQMAMAFSLSLEEEKRREKEKAMLETKTMLRSVNLRIQHNPKDDGLCFFNAVEASLKKSIRQRTQKKNITRQDLEGFENDTQLLAAIKEVVPSDDWDDFLQASQSTMDLKGLICTATWCSPSIHQRLHISSDDNNGISTNSSKNTPLIYMYSLVRLRDTNPDP
jgi:hypothetical protein